MNKLYVIALLAITAFSTKANAQTTVFDYDEGVYLENCIPSNFTWDGNPLLLLYSGENYDSDYIDPENPPELQIYNQDLELLKSFCPDFSNAFNYKYNYQTEVRDVEIQQTEVYEYRSIPYSEFEMYVRGNYGLGDFEIKEKTLTNGDKILLIDFSNSSDPGSMQYYTQRFYYGYNSFGMEYPRIFWQIEGDQAKEYQAEYSCRYTSDWYVKGDITTEEHSEKQTIWELGYSNFNTDGDDGMATITQTLFNNDASFEYILPKFILSTAAMEVSSDVVIDGGDEVYAKRTVRVPGQGNLAVGGFQIVSDNGNVVSEITFDEGFVGSPDYWDNPTVLTFGQNTYIVVQGYKDGKEACGFYKVNRNTSSVEKVKVMKSSMKLSKTIAKKNAPITVTFGDENADGSDIVVVSTSGQKVKHTKIPAMKKSATLNISAPAGIYSVSRLQKGKVKESQKVIIK